LSRNQKKASKHTKEKANGGEKGKTNMSRRAFRGRQTGGEEIRRRFGLRECQRHRLTRGTEGRGKNKGEGSKGLERRDKAEKRRRNARWVSKSSSIKKKHELRRT